MPQQKRSNPISGRLGDLIYYYRKDKKNRKVYFVRRAPETVRQTPATQRSATDFGTASKSSRLLRDALHEYTRLCYDNRLYSRLNTKMYEILRADVNHPSGQRIITADKMQALLNFRFNDAANIHQILKSTPVIEKSDSNEVNISLPGIFNNRSQAFRNVTHVSIKAIALSVNFTKGTSRQLESNTIVIRRGEEFAPVTMKINRRDLTLIILEVQSFYEMNGELHASQNKQTHALDVMAVLPPVVQPTLQQKKYRNKAPRFWVPYAAPATPAPAIIPVNFNSLPEG